jgi:hypothetical protein
MKSMAQAGSPVYPGHCFGQLLISGQKCDSLRVLNKQKQEAELV